MATTLLTNGPIGAGVTRRTTTPEHKLGMVAAGNDGTSWVYVGPAHATIAAAGVVAVTLSTGATSAGAGYTAETAFATGEYGWIRKTASPY